MKSFYQRTTNGYLLNKHIYAKTVKQIRCYPLFIKLIDLFEGKSQINIKERDVVNAMVAESYITAIDKGLNDWVSEEYRDAVFEHVVYEKEYFELELKYYFTAAAMKHWTQRFVYGVAVELGEDFEEMDL